MYEEVVVIYFEVLLRHLLGEAEETQLNVS